MKQIFNIFIKFMLKMKEGMLFVSFQPAFDHKSKALTLSKCPIILLLKRKIF